MVEIPALNAALALAIVAGTLSGSYYGFLRYFAEYLSKGEAFDQVKFVRSLSLGVVVGFTSGALGLTYTSAEEILASSGWFFLVILVLDKFVVPIGVGLLQKLVEFIARHLPKPPPAPV